MYCKKCGEKVSSTDKFCFNCGENIKRKNKNNKLLIIIVLILVVLFISSTSIFFGKKIASLITTNVNKQTSSNTTNGDTYYNDNYNNDKFDNDNSTITTDSFKNITVDDFITLKEAQDMSIVFIGRDSSSYCIQEKMILYTMISKYNLTINYLDITNISTEDYEKLATTDDYFNGNWGIPLTLIVKDGVIIDKVVGLNSATNLYTFFNKNGFIAS